MTQVNMYENSTEEPTGPCAPKCRFYIIQRHSRRITEPALKIQSQNVLCFRASISLKIYLIFKYFYEEVYVFVNETKYTYVFLTQYTFTLGDFKINLLS